jgi:hypothetical protein
MNRPLIYKLSTDDNGAPCITNDLLTLAICKPGYRHVAVVGDYLLGFMGRSQMEDDSEPLVYAARIDKVIPIQKYYTDKQYSSRPDCIYQVVNGEFIIKDDAIYHNYNNKRHIDRRDADLGDNRDANVLLSHDFRYFGKNAEPIDENKYPELTLLVRNLGQTNYPLRESINATVFDEACQLVGELWKRNPETMVLGTPMHPPTSEGDCGDGSEICVIEC